MWESAGLGKGTTVVDNDLINVAFMTGAGAAAGLIFGMLDHSDFDVAAASQEVMDFVIFCLAAGDPAP
jgi:Mg2+/citrate symporter